MTDASDQSRYDGARARLLQAAVEAFAEKGFHGTTTRDIASAAGMSPAAIYVHHRSKEELLYQISRDGHEQTLALIRAAIASSEDPGEALRSAVRGFCAHHAQDPTVARVVNYELSALSPEHSTEIWALRRTIDDEMHRLVTRGVEQGVFATTDPAMSAAAILSLGIDLARWYRRGGRWRPEELADEYAEMALRIVGAERIESRW